MPTAPEQIIISTEPAVSPALIAQAGMVVIPTTAASLASNLACISLLCGPLFAIPALIIAFNAEKITSQYPGHPDTKNVKTAKLLATISLVFAAAYILFQLSQP
jgi:hypothetical protein